MRGFLQRAAELVGDMGKPGRPPKDETEKYIARQIKLPPALAEKLDRLIPEGRRSQFIRDALARALKRVERQQKEDDPHA